MKYVFLFPVVFLVTGLVGGTTLYISGRIMLPEIGLTSPDFAACFWVSVFTAVGVAITAALAELVKFALS